MKAIQVPGLLTFTIAIVVFFTGTGLNRLIKPLHRWNIPEAVTGGLLAANRRIQPVIVGDGVESWDDRADQAPRQLWLVSYLLGRGTAAQQQQPQHGCGRDLEGSAPSCVGLDYLLPCPSLFFQSAKGRRPCPVYVTPDIRDGAAAGAAGNTPRSCHTNHGTGPFE
jgi:hypothetical protein